MAEDSKSQELEHFVGAGIAYEALMHHYVHYDEQMWDRTQLVIYVEGAAITASFLSKIVNTPWGAVIMLAALLLTAAIWRLKCLDYRNSRVNETTMDDIAEIIGSRIPSQPPRLRAEGGVIRGHHMLDAVFVGLLAIDLTLLVLNLVKAVPQIGG